MVVQRVYLVLEAALGLRFLAHYPQGIPLEHGEHGEYILQAASYANVTQEIGPGGAHAHRGGWRLRGHPRFNGMMRALVDWARGEGLLYGQRNRAVEDAIVYFRNEAAHPHNDLLVTPGESSRAIRTVAEIVNRLWGHDMPHGRVYGPPPAMDLFAVWWGDGTLASGYAEATGLCRSLLTLWPALWVPSGRFVTVPGAPALHQRLLAERGDALGVLLSWDG